MTGAGDRAPEQQPETDDDATDGVIVFALKGYAERHGAEGEGTQQANSEIAGTHMIIQQFTTRTRTRTRTRNGKGCAMPDCGPDQITHDEIQTLYDWLRTGQ